MKSFCASHQYKIKLAQEIEIEKKISTITSYLAFYKTVWVENQTPLMDIGQLKQTFELNNDCFQLGIIKGPTNVLVIQKHFIFTWPYTME